MHSVLTLTVQVVKKALATWLVTVLLTKKTTRIGVGTETSLRNDRGQNKRSFLLRNYDLIEAAVRELRGTMTQSVRWCTVNPTECKPFSIADNDVKLRRWHLEPAFVFSFKRWFVGGILTMVSRLYTAPSLFSRRSAQQVKHYMMVISRWR